jgi:high affinity sulfate transporter 1
VPFTEAYGGRGAFLSASKPPLTRRFLPFVRTLKGYDGVRLRIDAVAGLTVAALALPASMAYSELAGLPVTAGLYSLILPVIVYAFLGSTRWVVVGPEGTVALLIASGMAPLAIAGTAEYTTLAAALALAVGGVFLVARIVRLGWIADYFSQAVLVGYLTGVAVVMILGQVGKLVGLSSDATNAIVEAVDIASRIGDANAATLIVAVCSLGILFVLAYTRPKAPAALVVVTLGILASWILGLEEKGVDTTGSVPSGLPDFAIPHITGAEWLTLVPVAVSIFLVSFSDSILVARSFAAKRHETVDANQELVAMAGASAAAGLTQGMPGGTSGSRTAVNFDMGATSQVSGLVAAGAVAVILLFLTGPIAYLPSAVLGAVIVAASFKLIDPQQWRALARSSGTELAIAIVTAIAVVNIGVLLAIVVAVVLSIVDVVRRTARPNDAVLAWSQADDRYADVRTHQDGGIVPGVVIYRFSDRLFFANAQFFKRRVWAAVDGAPKPTRHLVLDMEGIPAIDASGAGALREVVEGLTARNVELDTARATDALVGTMERLGLVDLIGAEHMHPTVRSAVDCAVASPPRE